jgi:hypothetical protein
VIVVDQNTEVLQWVNSLDNFNLGCVRLDLVTFEVSQGLGTELIILSGEVLKQILKDPSLLKKLNECTGIVIFSHDPKEELQIPGNTLAIINDEMPRTYACTQLINIDNFIKSNNILKSQLISIDREMSEIMGGVENQMLRVKRSYERMAPKRLDEFSGVKIYSKYAAGDNQGSEFFDLFASGSKVFIMMSNTSSYLASSSILQLFSEMRGDKSIEKEDEIHFIKRVKHQIQNLRESQKKKITMQIMTCVFDLKTLKVEGHTFGNFKVISSNLGHNEESSTSIEVDDELSKFSFSLERGERLMLCSPGFIMNWQSLKPEFMIEELILNKKIKVLDVLDEVFFQLKKDTDMGFLKTDASSIILEVEENVMVQM